MTIGGVRRPRLRRSGHAWYYDHGGKPRCVEWEIIGPPEMAARRRGL